jgi:hypothetical protein
VLSLCITMRETPQEDGQTIASTQQTARDIYYLLFLRGLILKTTISCGAACG